MTKQDSTTEQPCWHCGVVLVTERSRCETCPSECDVEGCQEMGCIKPDAWCDDCHGYTHTADCPDASADDSLRSHNEALMTAIADALHFAEHGLENQALSILHAAVKRGQQ